MARGRMLSKSISTSERFARVSTTAGEMAEFSQLLYVLLIPHADDLGRQAGDCFTVKHVAFPASPRSLHEFETALSALECVGLIQRYESNDGKPVIQIAKFKPHQPGLKQRGSSFEPPPSASGSVPASPAPSASPEIPASLDFESPEVGTPCDAAKCRDLPPRTELNRTELNAEQKIKAAAPPPTRPATPKAAHGKPEDNYRQILAIVHKEILPTGVTDIGELEESTKWRCAKLRIAYNSEVVRKAVESALAARKAAKR